MYSIKNINIAGKLEFDRPMSELSCFKTGGTADILAYPQDISDIRVLSSWANENAVPVTILGGGANILVSDKGIRGLVIATSALDAIQIDENLLTAGAGAAISDVSAAAADAGLQGLEFIYSMPGSNGGAVWMNARCYDGEISEILESAKYYVPSTDEIVEYVAQAGDFAYKDSPFQHLDCIILESSYRLKSGADSSVLWEIMKGHQEDRTSKGHFTAPCAGSVFKNNRDFGAPSGKLIDSLGLRGTRIGDAVVSPDHANIIINAGKATSSDISQLIAIVHDAVHNELGFDLDPEVIKIGDWS